ncbi:hypothetical protein IAU60_002544 [Kwoniella sp. DSM 27419]
MSLQNEMFDDKGDVQHLEDTVGVLPSGEAAKNATLKAEAIAAEAADIEMGIWEAIRTHKSAVFWSLMVSMTVVMESYDLCLLGNLLAMPAFRKHFGDYVDETTGYQLAASWQTGLSQATTVGAFFGVLICGQIVEPLGYRRTILLGLVMMIGAVFLTFFAETLPVLLVGEFCCGVPWGFFINIAPAYASEVAPVSLRGILTIYVQTCWCIGQFVSSGVTYATHDRPDKWAYKIPFAIQWAWPVPLFAIIWFAPESPWWLIRKGRLAEAEKTVQRLASGNSRPAHETVSYMVRTNEIEKAETEGASYLDCFRGTEFRRTAIVCCMFAYQNFSGNQIGNQATYFFEQAGLPSTQAFSLGLGNTAIQMCAVFFCWILTAYFGRRTLYLFGVGFNFFFLIATGIVASVTRTTTTSWLQAVFLILIYAQYGLTIGPVTYSVIAETSSVRLRAKSVGLSRNFYYIWSVISGVLNSYMLNSNKASGGWDLAGKSGFVWAGTTAFVWVTCYFYLPEFKGRSYRELDILFHRRVPARKFASTKIDENDEE